MLSCIRKFSGSDSFEFEPVRFQILNGIWSVIESNAVTTGLLVVNNRSNSTSE